MDKATREDLPRLDELLAGAGPCDADGVSGCIIGRDQREPPTDHLCQVLHPAASVNRAIGPTSCAPSPDPVRSDEGLVQDDPEVVLSGGCPWHADPAMGSLQRPQPDAEGADALMAD